MQQRGSFLFLAVFCSGPDLLEPHILRSLSNIKAISIHTSCAGCHVVVLDIDGAAWLFGRNERCALGVAGKDVISENAPIKLTAHKLGASNDTKFVNAACGRNHTLLVGSDGQLWSAGANNMGQVSKQLLHQTFHALIFNVCSVVIPPPTKLQLLSL